MTIDLLSYLEADLDTESETVEDTTVKTMPEPIGAVIDTPMFRIELKVAEYGDLEVDASKGLFAMDVFNSLADKLVVRLASDTVTIRATICGDEAVADGSAPKVSQLFTAGKVKEEYRGTLSEAQVDFVEGRFAAAMLMLASAAVLSDKRAELFPRARQGLQFAYDAKERKGIFVLKDAVNYRIENGATLTAIKQRVAQSKTASAEVAALHNVDLAELI
jgi:hypothetical protein